MRMRADNGMKNNQFKFFSKALASVVIIANLFYFIPFTIEIIISGGGPMGFGLALLPFLFLIHLLIIPSLYVFRIEIKTLIQKIQKRN